MYVYMYEGDGFRTHHQLEIVAVLQASYSKYVSSYCYICALILLYIFPHATIYRRVLQAVLQTRQCQTGKTGVKVVWKAGVSMCSS
jgi:hypothetical protein